MLTVIRPETTARYSSDLEQRSRRAGTARTRARGRSLRGVQGRPAAGGRSRGAGDGQRLDGLGRRALGAAAGRGRGSAGAAARRPRDQQLLRLRAFSGHRPRAHLALRAASVPLSLGTPNAGVADGSRPGGARVDAAGAAADAGRHRHRGHGEGLRTVGLRFARDRHLGEPVRRDAVAPRGMGGGRRARCDRRDTDPVAMAGRGPSGPHARGRGGDRKPLLAGRIRRFTSDQHGSAHTEAVDHVAAVTRK